MRWLWKRQRPAPGRRSFAELQALLPEQRRAAFAGKDGRGWIEAAALHGLVEAQVLLGQVLLDRGDAALALPWFKAAAGAGYTPARNMVGRCFEMGWGVKPDPVEAARHYRQAAEAGLGWGQFNLANLLLYRIGVSRDRLQAFDWYGRAAQQGHAKAMNMLARFHEEGWDRPKDPEQAAGWYRRAAEAGDFRAQYNLATLLAQHGRRVEALAWLDRAFAHGSPDFLAQAGAALRANSDPAFQAIGRRATTRLPPVSRKMPAALPRSPHVQPGIPSTTPARKAVALKSCGADLTRPKRNISRSLGLFMVHDDAAAGGVGIDEKKPA